jgi:hypothetical protein
MRRVAANRVYINNKEFYNNHIIELFDSYVVNHFPLQSELAMTEWLGGIIMLTNASEVDTSSVYSVEDFYRKAEESDSHTKYLKAYHIYGVDIQSGKFKENSMIVKLTCSSSEF